MASQTGARRRPAIHLRPRKTELEQRLWDLDMRQHATADAHPRSRLSLVEYTLWGLFLAVLLLGVFQALGAADQGALGANNAFNYITTQLCCQPLS